MDNREIGKLIVIAIFISAVLPMGLSLIILSGTDVLVEEGDNGHYLGTYSFRNEVEGTSGSNIVFIDIINNQDPNTIVQINNSVNSYNKILELIDTNMTGNINFENSFSSRLFGTVEFWIRFNNITVDGFSIRLDAAVLWVFGGKWYRKSDGPPGYTLLLNVNDPIIDTWIHIKIDWRSNAGPVYKGLPVNYARYTIDDISSGNVPTDQAQGSVNSLNIFTTNNYTGTIWFDAFGYVWDNNYNEGDNKNYLPPVYLVDIIDPGILSLLTIVLPIIIVVAIIFYFIRDNRIK